MSHNRKSAESIVFLPSEKVIEISSNQQDSILKVAVSEDVQNCTDEGIQVFGGMGFSEETPMEAAWRDARIARIYEGTNEINRMLSVGMLVKKAMKGHVDLLNPAMAVADELMGIPSFDVPDYSELFSEEKAMIAKLKKVFLMVAGSAVQKFGFLHLGSKIIKNNIAKHRNYNNSERDDSARSGHHCGSFFGRFRRR